MKYESLIKEAEAARASAYAPYSQFPVGAALLGRSGRVFRGCNVENAAYPVGWCAERTAVGAAVVAGEREFRAIAIVADAKDVCVPCGLCRQTLIEFAEQMDVVMANLRGEIDVVPLDELMPRAFGPNHLPT